MTDEIKAEALRRVNEKRKEKGWGPVDLHICEMHWEYFSVILDLLAEKEQKDG